MCEIKMVKKPSREELRQKIFDEKLKRRDAETKQMDAWWDKDQKAYLKYTKRDRHPMAYTVNKEVEENWRSAPLRLEIERNIDRFAAFCTLYMLFWLSIGGWVAYKLLTA